MTNVPLSFLPGVCKVNSSYADSKQMGVIDGRQAIGRFTDMDKVQFIAGFPEKIGGWEKEIDTAFEGVPRGMKDWRANSQAIYLGVGTNLKLYYYSQNEQVDITPYRGVVTGSLTNPFTTSIGLPTVSVNDTAHGLSVGDYVILTGGSSVGGITIANVYFVTTVTDADNYVITTSTNATSSVSGGGGTTTYTYFRIQLTNPFATVSGSTTVTVTHTLHGASAGDYVTFENASAVGGLTIDGEYTIMNVSSDSYTITAASAASSTASGGGTVSAQYDISVGRQDSALAFGYGVGGYGLNGYGETSDTSILLAARTWCIQNYGQQMLANPSGGTIYIWDPTIGGRAYPMYGAPTQVLGMFVTSERFVVALGVEDIAMKIAWPDQTDYTIWTSTPTNTANSGRTLQEGSFMVNGTAVRDGVSLMWSNTSAYAFDYTGDNSVYESPVIGKQCGLIGPLAFCVVGGVVYWFSNSEFWMWNGSVQPLPSDDIRDYVYKDINLTQAAKFNVQSNIAKKQVIFRYCSADSDEIDRYVIWHIDQNCFSIGTMERTCGIDKNLFSYPMACDADGYLYNHDFGVDADGGAMDSYIVFNPMDIADGNRLMDVFGFVPDFQTLVGDGSVYPLGRDYPMSDDVVYGPYTVAADGSTPLVDFRLSGRLFGYKWQQNVLGGNWRLGLPHADIQPAGARR